ncbi:MAG: EF-hand domain-containing protein [Verrucomicrobia bacterium]|nr:EF-hand domain-containing protein [Verrucomicrobiota bacterium]
MKQIYPLLVGACLLGLFLPPNVLAAKADGKKAKLIAKYDKNGDGTLDADEMAALRKDLGADKDGDLKAYDKDGDGKLSDEEISAIKPGAAKTPKVGTPGEKPKKEKKPGTAKPESPGEAGNKGASEASGGETAPAQAE